MGAADLHLYHGALLTLPEIARRTGINYHTLRDRMRAHGQTAEEAVDHPFDLRGHPPARHPYKGELLTTAEIARRTGLSYGTLKARMRRGLTAEQAAEGEGYVQTYRRRHYAFRGRQMTLNAIADAVGMSRQTLWARVHRGIPLEDAVRHIRRYVRIAPQPPEEPPQEGPPQEAAPAPCWQPSDPTAVGILQAVVYQARVTWDGDTYTAEGLAGLYRWTLTSDADGYTLTAVYLPTGRASGEPRRYDRQGVHAPWMGWLPGDDTDDDDMDD